jgi:hypothetical protein
MKQIEIQGRTFLYEVNQYSGDHDSGGCEITHFYKPTPTIKTRKKYLLWGPDVNYLEYERLFSLHYDIESPTYTKENITKLIMDKIAILNRAEEIKRGEIIATPEDAKIFVDAIAKPPKPNAKLKGAAKKYRDANQKNYEHLKFIYERLKNVHAENENYDYMVRLKEIIDQYKNLYN